MRRLEGSNLSQTWWEAPKVGATGKRHPQGTPETLWIHRTSLGRPRNFHLDPKSGHNTQSMWLASNVDRNFWKYE